MVITYSCSIHGTGSTITAVATDYDGDCTDGNAATTAMIVAYDYGIDTP